MSKQQERERHEFNVNPDHNWRIPEHPEAHLAELWQYHQADGSLSDFYDQYPYLRPVEPEPDRGRQRTR